MWWEPLAATALGAIIALAGGGLAAWLPLRERRAERRSEAVARRQNFERKTIEILVDLLPKVMRDATLVHGADADAARKTGVYAGHLLPSGLTPNELEHARQFARHTAFILDDELRAEAEAFQNVLNGHGAPEHRTLAEGESDFLSLVRHYDALSASLAARLRTLWNLVGQQVRSRTFDRQALRTHARADLGAS